MTPHELNAEISRHAGAGMDYQKLFGKLVRHPHSRWPDWCRCMGSTDVRIQRKAWRRLSSEFFPETSLNYALGMPRTPKWVLPLTVSEFIKAGPDDLTLCWLLYNTARQDDAEFRRVVEVVKRRGRLKNKFSNICEPIPPRIQAAVGNLLVSA